MIRYDVIRYDVLRLGGANPDFDVVCPKCCSAIGFPCTDNGVHGMIHRSKVHPERKKREVSTNIPATTVVSSGGG